MSAMVIAAIVPEWIRKYGIKSLLNTPCASSDCETFLSQGIERVLGINIVSSSTPNHVIGDLVNWKPEGEWDAAYVNCFFCGQNASKAGGYAEAARNIAAWPVRYLILYDTAYIEKDRNTDWHPEFLQAGWTLLESHPAEMVSVVEIWGHAS